VTGLCYFVCSLTYNEVIFDILSTGSGHDQRYERTGEFWATVGSVSSIGGILAWLTALVVN